MEKHKVHIDNIVVNEQVQQREMLDVDTISDYADQIVSANEADGGLLFPPLVVFDDGKRFILADGFHRIAAYREAKVYEVEVIVHQGNERAAILHAVGANANHGLRRTNGDKRKAVRTLLMDDEWRGLSDRQIAERCRVSQPFVGKVRDELTQKGYQSDSRRIGKDGRVINTANIGTKPRSVDESKDEAGDTSLDESIGEEVPNEDNPLDEGPVDDFHGDEDDEQDGEPSDESESAVSSDQEQTPPEVQPEVAEESDNETGEEPEKDDGDDEQAGDPGELEADPDDEPDEVVTDGPKVTAEEVRSLQETISDLRASLEEKEQRIAELEGKNRNLEKQVASLRVELGKTADLDPSPVGSGRSSVLHSRFEGQPSAD